MARRGLCSSPTSRWALIIALAIAAFLVMTMIPNLTARKQTRVEVSQMHRLADEVEQDFKEAQEIQDPQRALLKTNTALAKIEALTSLLPNSGREVDLNTDDLIKRLRRFQRQKLDEQRSHPAPLWQPQLLPQPQPPARR